MRSCTSKHHNRRLYHTIIQIRKFFNSIVATSRTHLFVFVGSDALSSGFFPFLAFEVFLHLRRHLSLLLGLNVALVDRRIVVDFHRLRVLKL